MKSSRLLTWGKRTGLIYMASQVHVPGAEHERAHRGNYRLPHVTIDAAGSRGNAGYMAGSALIVNLTAASSSLEDGRTNTARSKGGNYVSMTRVDDGDGRRDIWQCRLRQCRVGGSTRCPRCCHAIPAARRHIGSQQPACRARSHVVKPDRQASTPVRKRQRLIGVEVGQPIRAAARRYWAMGIHAII